MLGATRLLLVSNYDSNTAVTIFRLGGPADTVMGTLLPLVPQLLPVVAVVLFVLRQWWASFISAVCALLVAHSIHPEYGVGTLYQLGAERFATYAYGIYGYSGTAKICHELHAQCRAYPATVWWPSGGWLPRFRFDGTILSDRPIEFIVILVAVLAAFARPKIHNGNLAIMKQDGPLGKDAKGGGGSSPGPSGAAGAEADILDGLLDSVESCLGLLGRLFRWVIRSAIMVVLIPSLLAVLSALYPVPTMDGGFWGNVLHRMWSPAELVSLKSGEQLVGYTLGDKDGWKVLLVDKGRAIKYVKPDDVKERVVCTLEPVRKVHPYFAATSMPPADYPPCYRNDKP